MPISSAPRTGPQGVGVFRRREKQWASSIQSDVDEPPCITASRGLWNRGVHGESWLAVEVQVTQSHWLPLWDQQHTESPGRLPTPAAML